jgi:hypothetical protein
VKHAAAIHIFMHVKQTSLLARNIDSLMSQLFIEQDILSHNTHFNTQFCSIYNIIFQNTKTSNSHILVGL